MLFSPSHNFEHCKLSKKKFYALTVFDEYNNDNQHFFSVDMSTLNLTEKMEEISRGNISYCFIFHDIDMLPVSQINSTKH
jgi:hypothetical protein